MKLKFSIDSWTAWSSASGGCSGSKDSVYQNVDNELELNLSHIPSMKRRRMNHQCKMAVSTALDCLSQVDSSQPRCVFASQHGELGRSIKIINSMIESGDISPTDFSMSVHNSALGLFSILSANKQSATSIAAGEETFGYGFLEACMQLSLEPEVPVLYVFFDQPLPSELAQFDSIGAESRCIALLLRTPAKENEKFVFEMTPLDSSTNTVPLGTSGVSEFVAFCSNPTNSLELVGATHRWNWSR